MAVEDRKARNLSGLAGLDCRRAPGVFGGIEKAEKRAIQVVLRGLSCRRVWNRKIGKCAI